MYYNKVFIHANSLNNQFLTIILLNLILLDFEV